MGLVDGASDVFLGNGLDGVVDHHLEHLCRGGRAEKHKYSQTNKEYAKSHGIFHVSRNRRPEQRRVPLNDIVILN